MQPPILKTYRPEMPLGENVFYIQSKGLHSGRVLKNPIPNCFTAICSSKEHSDFWTSICTALYLGRKYQILILGSVVPFIRLRETAELLSTMKHLDTNQVQATTKQLNLIDEALKSSIERTKLIKQLQSATAQALTTIIG